MEQNFTETLLEQRREHHDVPLSREKKDGAVLDNAKMLFRNDEKKQIKEVYPI